MPKEGIIYCRVFPEENNEDTIKAAEEFRRNAPVEKRIPPSLGEALAAIEQKFEYRPRPGAEERIKMIVDYAISVCEEFEIETAILRNDREIDVSMSISVGPYFGPVKEALGKLMRFSDDVTLTTDKNKPEYICITMGYYTHDRYNRTTGEKAVC